MGTLSHYFKLWEIFEGVTTSENFAVYSGALTSGHSINFRSIPSILIPKKRVWEVSTGTDKKSASKKALQLDYTALQLTTKMLLSRVKEELVAIELVIQQVVRTLRENYQGKQGWNSEDLLDEYELFKSIVKAKAFLALDVGKEEATWQHCQIMIKSNLLTRVICYILYIIILYLSSCSGPVADPGHPQMARCPWMAWPSPLKPKLSE